MEAMAAALELMGALSFGQTSLRLFMALIPSCVPSARHMMKHLFLNCSYIPYRKCDIGLLIFSTALGWCRNKWNMKSADSVERRPSSSVTDSCIFFTCWMSSSLEVKIRPASISEPVSLSFFSTASCPASTFSAEASIDLVSSTGFSAPSNPAFEATFDSSFGASSTADVSFESAVVAVASLLSTSLSAVCAGASATASSFVVTSVSAEVMADYG
mmetsp:Transcript_12401/g.20272  ORF Transcript_12401/g.20272 Transcript_12401/m.20272 type:complete len:215 (-) Transcript_12401:21-665(-)